MAVQNTIADFISDVLEANADSEITTQSAYSRYCLWCKKNNYTPDLMAGFRKQIVPYAEIVRKRPAGQPTENPVAMILGYKFKDED